MLCSRADYHNTELAMWLLASSTRPLHKFISVYVYICTRAAGSRVNSLFDAAQFCSSKSQRQS